MTKPRARGRIIGKFASWFAVTFISAGVGGLGGYFLGDYLAFKSEKRAEIRSEYQQVEHATSRVLDDLQAFSDQAKGLEAVDPSRKYKFRKNMTSLYQDAEDVVTRVPEAKPEFNEFANALVDLQQTALDMTGPADAKHYVEAVSRFLKAHKDFDNKVITINESYANSFD